MEALSRAIGILGGQAGLALAIGVKQQHVWNWLHRAKGVVPAEHCMSIERETRERGLPVTCEELRPELPWYVLRAKSSAAPSATPSRVAVSSEATE